MNNNVVFKGSGKEIVIVINDKISFEELKKSFKEKVISTKSFFEGVNTSIAFKGRKLSEIEELELLDIISLYSGLEVSYITDVENPIVRIFPKKEIEKITKFEDITQNLDVKCSTFYHKGSIRSGQCINFKGSVIVIGDVNPGGEIKAEGNIIVLGKLKGVAHAGCKGDKSSFVSSLYMIPTQLIIGDVITYFPQDTKRIFSPEYAYVKDNQIYVEQLITYLG